MKLRESWMGAAHALQWAYSAQALAGDVSTSSQLGRLQSARGGLPGDKPAMLRAQAQMIMRVADEALHGDTLAHTLTHARRMQCETLRRMAAMECAQTLPTYGLPRTALAEAVYRWLLRPMGRSYMLRQERLYGGGRYSIDRLASDYGITRRVFREAVELVETYLDGVEISALDRIERAMGNKGWIGGD